MRRALRPSPAAEALAAAEHETLAAEERHAEAREIETRHRGPLAEAERAAQRLETEARTVAGLLGSYSSGPWPRAVDAVSVARGYEAALGAALGDDLDASVHEAAPAHWSVIEPADEDPLLPVGADRSPATFPRRLRSPAAWPRSAWSLAPRESSLQVSSSPASGWSRSKATSGAGTVSSPLPKRRLRPRGASWKRIAGRP